MRASPSRSQVRLAIVTLSALLTSTGLATGAAAVSSGLFTAPVGYATQVDPHAVALADLNTDSKTDLIVTNAGSDTVSVRLGDGSGAFGSAVAFATGDKPKFTTVADLDGDGDLDLATANQTAGTASVLLGTGTGSFGTKTDYPTCTGAHETATGDVNEDGKLDLLVACWGSPSIAVLLGVGDGTFAAKTDVASGSGPHSLVVGRFDADAHVDVAVANHGEATISVLLGIGDGRFHTRVKYSVGNGPHSVRAADLDEDGALDLAVANDGSDSVSVLLGVGTGTFGAQTTFPAGSVPKSVAIGDLDGDENLDLIASDTGGNGDGVTGHPGGAEIRVLLGNGDGTFDAAIAETVGATPYSAVIGRVDADGWLDVATANWDSDTATVLLGVGDRTPPPPPDDTTPPTITKPSVSVATATVSTAAFNLALAWTASDADSGLASVQIRRSVDGAPSTLVATVAPATTSYRASVAPGHTYRFDLRATDVAGNIADSSTGSIRTTMYNERTSLATYAGTWTTLNSSVFLNGHAKASTRAGASVTVKVVGKGIAWIAPRGPRMGSARIYVDGVNKGIVNLYATTNRYRQVAFQAAWPSNGSHTLRIVLLGPTSHPRVDVDGVIVLRD